MLAVRFRVAAHDRALAPPQGVCGGPEAVEDDGGGGDGDGVTRIHAAPVLRQPELEAQRTDLLARASRLTRMRADTERALNRFQAMTAHQRAADTAWATVVRRAAWGAGVTIVCDLAAIGALVADYHSLLERKGEWSAADVALGFGPLLSLAAGLCIPLPAALRWAYHEFRGGSDGDRAQAAAHFIQVAREQRAHEHEYAQRQAAFRTLELAALRAAAVDAVLASTPLPRVLARMVLAHLEPDAEPLRSTVPLPQRTVEIVVLD